MRTTSCLSMLSWSKEWASLETWSLSWSKLRVSPESASTRARFSGEDELLWKRTDVRERLGIVGSGSGGRGDE